mgnify:CR=1 FL=1
MDAEIARLRAEVEMLRNALHDAEAIGDFATDLRDRLALKENTETCAKLAAEAVADRDCLRAALLMAKAHLSKACPSRYNGGEALDALRAAESALSAGEGK